MRFPIKPPPKIKQFLVLSLGLHLAAFTAYHMIPPGPPEAPEQPPIKVKYVPKKPELKKEKPPQVVDPVQPKEQEPPKTSELISNANSQSKSHIEKRTDKLFASKKSLIPKPKPETMPQPEKMVELSKEFLIPPPKTPREVFQEAKTGFDKPEPEVTQKKKAAKKYSESTLALLDGFDPEKYAAIDADSMKSENPDDEDEVISLNTKEAKYASYFQRIKQQIERVWTYPEEAARHGINGRLSLRFRISRDGRLLEVLLIDASGSNLLDEAAVNAVKNAAPYYPFPVTIDRDNLSILATFIYSPAYSTYYQDRYGR
ncbi:TonB family protein [Nitrospina gracilis]|uniref:TonB family protein n=1 Tax=Nitrospina gracilis TaxID=35801 RepID=UPI001F02E53E|nr:TonB family protein [Nitrospina gracilis]MCF8719282.1 protein TonB [Nitrospina gracilis Nb-211]